jgi:L-lysine exporter family protein LysE/ArgO
LNFEGMVFPALAGLALGGSLIVAIGAQNAFILRMGLLRQHVFVLCLTCAVSDAVLIGLGVAGVGAIVSANPGILRVLALAGALFLFAYAALSARRALYPKAISAEADAPVKLSKAIATVLAFTFLNPHVYLDTVVLVGSFSATYAGSARLAFGIGAAVASFVWFFGLGYGASLLTPLFAKPAAWRVLDTLIAVVMALLASALLREGLR